MIKLIKISRTGCMKIFMLFLAAFFFWVQPLTGHAAEKGQYYISVHIGNSFSHKGLNHTYVASGRVEQGVGYPSYATRKRNLKASTTFGLALGSKLFNRSYIEIEFSCMPRYKFTSTDRYLVHFPVSNLYFPSQNKDRALLRLYSAFVNIKHTIKEANVFVLYVLAGVGMSYNKIHNFINENSAPETGNSDKAYNFALKRKKTNFSWQAGAGVLLHAHKNIKLGLEYKYGAFGSVSSGHYENDASIIPLRGKLHTSNVLFRIIYEI